MTRFLCISVQFLLGRYHGRTEGDRASEWPPSPLRLFQALLAAAHRGRGDSPLSAAEERALKWFEGDENGPRPAPIIITAEAREATPYVISVPNNDLDIWARPLSEGRQSKKQPAELRSMKIVRPTSLGEDIKETSAEVHFLWLLPDAQERAETIHTNLDHLARRMVTLGWGTDPVAACARILGEAQVAALSGTRWLPGPPGDPIRSRRPLPVAGTLDALRRRHGKFLSRVDGRGRQYEHVRPYFEMDEAEAPRRFASYFIDGAPLHRPFAAFALRQPGAPGKFRAFRQQYATKVSAMLRHVACVAAKENWPFPEGSDVYVAGHGAPKRGPTPPRFSYLPLPSIGGTRADGMIRRIMIAEPFDAGSGGCGSHAAWALQRLTGRQLVDEDTKTAIATLERLDVHDSVLTLYTRSSREWITSTPIALPGYDDLKVHKAAALLSRACDQAGFPPGSVEGFEFTGPTKRNEPRYFVPRYLRGLPLRHTVIRFTRQTCGPVAIGAGRHCGLGVFSVHGPWA